MTQVAAKAAAMKGTPPQHPGIHHTQNSSLTSFGSDIEMNPNILMSTQSSELERAANATEHTSSESGQITALMQENKLLRVCSHFIESINASSICHSVSKS